MHKKFTLRVRKFRYVTALTVFGFLFLVSGLMAQTPWSGVYGNEWLAGKYGQAWIKIGVNKNGIQRVTLPADFQNKAGLLHLYHRGVEVAITSATSTQIEFYGILNNGASDALLYRPYTGTRANPYYSWFSDESAYFLTFSTDATNLASTQQTIEVSGTPESYHLQKDLTVYANDYTHDETTNVAIVSLDNSYFQEGKAATGRLIWKYQTPSNTFIGDSLFVLPFQLKNLVIDQNNRPQIEVLLNGRTYAGVVNKVRVSKGKTTSTLVNDSEILQFSGFTTVKKQYNLNVSANPDNSDVDASGNGVFQLANTYAGTAFTNTGAFSVTYLRISYPQKFDMLNLNSATFNLLPTLNALSQVRITNAPANAKIYDITNPDIPRIIPANFEGSTLVSMVQRSPNTELNLFVSSETISVDNSKVTSVAFTDHKPADNDYLIVTNETLFSASNDYAEYRKSTIGGGYKTLIVKIKDVYNQFNYGEPSPVAIRRYVDYMIHNNLRDKHNLLLIGPSTTIESKMKLNRELVGDVPTIGYPGSDVLLVEGLIPGTSEIPSLPIGRISATTTDQVQHYLQKVKDYEAQYNQNLDWRKKVFHVSGGLHDGENTKFAQYLADYSSYITNSPFNGNITAKVKADGDFGYPSNALNIHSDINNGIGALVYYGHGSPTQTDNNIGYVSDGVYNNTGKYPFLYFNGCGVGNIFSGRFAAYPTTTDQIPLSSDWLLGQDKGSIANIANSYYAFEESSHLYIGALYQNLYNKTMTIGQVHKRAAQIIMTGNAGGRVTAASEYDIASNHQSLLHGDPALRLLVNTSPLPVDLKSFEAKLVVPNQVDLKWITAWEKNNSHFNVERSYNAKTFEVIGYVEGKGDSNAENSYSFYDKNPNPGVNYYRLSQVDGLTDNSSSAEGKVTKSRIISIEIPNTAQLYLAPNPTQNVVEIGHISSIEIQSWNLIDIRGKVLLQNGNGNKVNLSRYPVGEYIIEIKTLNGDVYRKKVVKQ